MAVTMHPAKSSHIAAVGLDPKTGELHVAFVSGGTYIHGNVSAEMFDAMMGAKSIGEHYHKHFRGNSAHSVRKKEAEAA